MSGTRWGVEEWGDHDWGWIDFERQYQPVSPFETQPNDSLSVRAVNDFIDGINNAKAFALSHKLRSDVFFPAIQSPNASSTKTLLRVFAPVWIPYGLDLLSLWVGHNRTNGAGHTHWELFISGQPYRTFGAFSEANFTTFTNSVEWISSLDTHTIDADLTLALPENNGSREFYLCLTATNSDGSTRSRITTLDIKPKLGI